MQLEILLPYQVFASLQEVLRIVVKTNVGSLGLLPQRLDCVAVLVPGILVYETAAAGTRYVAVDEGVMTKVGNKVSVSVRHAIGGADLAQLQDAVKREFLTRNEEEQQLRGALSRMEGGFMRRFAEFEHEK